MSNPSNPNEPAAYPAQNAPAAPQKTNVLSIVALILGIVVPIGGIICGPIALKQINRTGEGGRGLAKAGLIIGIILFVIEIASTIGMAVLINNAADTMSTTTY